jgi:hypothetical protein
MSVQAVHAVVHTPEEVRAILAEATEIADEMVENGFKWTPTFHKAADLLSARATMFIQPQSVPLDLAHLRSTG